MEQLKIKYVACKTNNAAYNNDDELVKFIVLITDLSLKNNVIKGTFRKEDKNEH